MNSAIGVRVTSEVGEIKNTTLQRLLVAQPGSTLLIECALQVS
jgi:hypothetical protein